MDEGGIAQWGTGEDSQELFELTAVASFDGMVTAVMGSWGDFVDPNFLFLGEEKFYREESGRIQFLHTLQSNGLDAGLHFFANSCGGEEEFHQIALGVEVHFYGGVHGMGTILCDGYDDGDFEGIGNE